MMMAQQVARLPNDHANPRIEAAKRPLAAGRLVGTVAACRGELLDLDVGARQHAVLQNLSRLQCVDFIGTIP